MKYVKFEKLHYVIQLPDILDYLLENNGYWLDELDDHLFNNCDWFHNLVEEEEWGDGEFGKLQEYIGDPPIAVVMPYPAAVALKIGIHNGYSYWGVEEEDPNTVEAYFRYIKNSDAPEEFKFDAMMELAVYLSHSLKITRMHLKEARDEVQYYFEQTLDRR